MNLKALDKAIAKLSDTHILGPRTEEEVAAAERQLGLTFAEDYRAYLLKYGVVCGDEMELTGLTKEDECYNVVIATLAEREYDDDFPKDAYVVHDWAYDGIVAIQYANGEIYARGPGYMTKKMNDSLAEYIEEGIEIYREDEDEDEDE